MCSASKLYVHWCTNNSKDMAFFWVTISLTWLWCLSCCLLQGEEEESDMSAPEIVTHHRGGHRRPQPRRQAVPYDLLPHQKGHRAVHRGTAEHFPEAALRMGHQHDDEDSGASEADLLCSEVLSESHDEGSDVGSDEMYARRHYRIPQVSFPPCCLC